MLLFRFLSPPLPRREDLLSKLDAVPMEALGSSLLVSALAISCRTTVSKLRRAAAMQPAYNKASIPFCICDCSYSPSDWYHIFPGDEAVGLDL